MTWKVRVDVTAGHMQLGSLPGWRFAFMAVAALSFLIGALTLWLGKEPRKLWGGASATAIAPKEGGIDTADIASHMLSVMRIPTFGLIVAQARTRSRKVARGEILRL